MQTAKPFKSTSSTTSTYTTLTLWRRDTPVHVDLMYHTKTNEPHQLITTRHSCFNEYDSSKLEEWQTDIETAADLTDESQAKLAKAKLRGLICTLVTEAINSDKSWDKIRDLLQLKLCNADIHNYTSCFMEIQCENRNSLQCTSIGLKQRLRDATLQIMLLPSDSSSKD